ncbi:MAG TPA: SDR family NAD(P)-dependent oxidoreductase [Mycobacteriales bacterium]|jgi:NAD(P)-dependent dehydrogenase (short-subunit alcohol dehydrogenase family)|nr:SDR family NAD(P)-dependent oxidoreductase [Mycobacteriales bacterium]HVX69487.1 SDR family NAD(P)-dependent oxidoreductase [Mycobacteriales bacterium]
MAEITFDGRVAIVTGAGGGLGRTYALELARRGAKVVVNDLGGSVDGTGGEHTAAQKVVDEITAAGGEAVPSYDSVSTPEGGENIVKTAVDSFGKVDVVINNAGILRDKSFAKLTWDDLDAVLDVHLKGAFYVSQPAFKVMKENGYGRFVFTASNAGVFGNFGQTNYGAAKMGLVGLSNIIAIEGEKSGIKSNVLCPVAATRMTMELLGDFASQLEPELVTPLVTFLASEACDRTHEIFSAAGGRYARVFVGLAPGWYGGKGHVPTAEDVLDNLDQIEKQDGYIVPGSVGDELGALVSVLAG